MPRLPSKRRRSSRDDGSSRSSPSFDDTLVEMKNDAHKTDAFDKFSRLRSEGKMCDFVIEIQGEGIHVHSAVLVATSKYYEGMLTHDTEEKKNGRVEIHDVELSAGKQCIDYMYTGKANFSVKNPEDLIFAAELMELPSLTDMYFEFLKEKISVKNCLKYVQLAETFGRRSFAEFFSKFSAKNFEEIIENDDFLSLSNMLIQQCLEFVPDGGQYVENLKWQALKTWIDEDVENRKQSFLNLFKMLKLENVSDDFLTNVLRLDPLVDENSECSKLILNALSSPKNYVGCNKTVPCIIVCHSDSRMLYQYKLKTKTWSRFARIPADVYEKNPDIVSVNGQVYLTTWDAVSRFQNGELVLFKATGHEPRYEHCHQCIIHGTIIYMVFRHCTYKFDTKTNALTVLQTPLSMTLLDGFFLTSSDRYIYALGGSSDGKYAKEFDFLSDTWESITPMQVGRQYGAALWYDSKVFALGGSDEGRFTQGSSRAEFYSPESNMWTFLSPNFRCIHYKCKAFSIDDNVYIVGGNQHGSTPNVLGFDTVETCNSSNQASTVEGPYPWMAKIDFKESTVTRITTMKIDSGLACAVYAN